MMSQFLSSNPASGELEPTLSNAGPGSGLLLSPAMTEAAVAFQTQPDLWAEVESLLEPWANVTLTCHACLKTMNFELFKDGVTQELVHLGLPAMEYQFPLGPVTSDTQGLYRCRSGLSSGWTQLSNLLEVTGAETLPPPVLSTEPVSWITPGLETKLLCRGGFRGVTFLLRLEGDDQFLEVFEAPTGVEATFPVRRPGNYSCSYRTHAAGAPSEPSATVTVEELGAPLPPTLSLQGESAAAVLHPGVRRTLVCVAPLSGVHFQLRRGEEVLQVPMSSTSPDRVFFHLNAVALGDGGLYTCRYQLRGQQTWSVDSAPAELLLSDETLPAPELSAEPATPRPAPGASLQLRCRAPRRGLRFALVREDAGQRRVHRVLSPAGTEAHFELRDVSAADSANYSCVYVDTEPPFAGSAPSAPLELCVEGPPPRPQLRPLWRGAVTPGRDAVLRCEGQVPDVTFELLRAGEKEALTQTRTAHRSADLVLTYVGPQHVGNYSCRYRRSWPKVLVSEFSEPVELQVAGS
ncbi:alpha-1B-glycoprotein isoform X2 [Prionailurus viverrinus]|uniref:alpha-1B-glycoprotein isoform X2 n=1 Tax=Prionailurus viverrinus TaxID=61388 RepID=UPI001FF4C672|nr:alpha-1B-glycoprotein isoform X2 [Prionailurus viverrinus]XP_047690289.1 alpha-1B-glycoprotein isoform X2 [Prionailurus viverrinus]